MAFPQSYEPPVEDMQERSHTPEVRDTPKTTGDYRNVALLAIAAAPAGVHIRDLGVCHFGPNT